MSMNKEQAQRLSEITGVEYVHSECPKDMRFHEFCAQQFRELLATYEDEINRYRDKEPFTAKEAQLVSKLLVRRSTFYVKVGTFVDGLRIDHDSTYKQLMTVGYRPGKTGRAFGKKLRIANVPTMSKDNQWKISVQFVPSKAEQSLPISDIVLDGLEEAIISGVGKPDIGLLSKDECEVVEGDIEATHFRQLRLRKIPTARFPHRWSVFEWVKAGWLYTRVAQVTN